MIRCDTPEERAALVDLTYAVMGVIPIQKGRVSPAMRKLMDAYDRLADTVIGLKPPSERYHRG